MLFIVCFLCWLSFFFFLQYWSSRARHVPRVPVAHEWTCRCKTDETRQINVAFVNGSQRGKYQLICLCSPITNIMFPHIRIPIHYTVTKEADWDQNCRSGCKCLSGKTRCDERIMYLHIQDVFFHFCVHLFTPLLLIPKIPLSDVFVIIDPSLLLISWSVKCLPLISEPPRPGRLGCVFAECIPLVPQSCVCLRMCPLPSGSLHLFSQLPPPTFTLHPTLLFLKVSYLPRPPIFLLPNPLTPTVPLSCLSLNPRWWSVLLTPAEQRRNGVVTAVTRSCQSLSSTLHWQPRSEGSLFIWIQRYDVSNVCPCLCRREISKPPSPQSGVHGRPGWKCDNAEAR